jgi:hypothetical protein
MHPPVTVERMPEASPRTRARITGAVYLLFFLTAVCGSFFSPASPTGIVAQDTAFRLGFALTLISTACYVAVTALFYRLFWPVSRSIALVAAFFGLVGCAITAFGSLFQLASLVVLGSNPDFGVFSVKQLQAQAQILLDLNALAGDIALVFFGLFLLLTGYLIFRSTFLPRILAAPIALAGLGWLTFLWPPLVNHLLIYVEVLGFLAELSLMLWLLFMGVNAERWNEQATAVGISLGGTMPRHPGTHDQGQPGGNLSQPGGNLSQPGGNS